ncbi:SRPBCC domain-containing protein [Aureimonas sp. AU4]|uniref:SRPBCC family protein n=1 Tax=Aureimonas sp. AU4 TaxID=1638163 RepID=UPI000706312E|nr:SRPBCC domain-containing protein [Aureimonas sp. AU4]BAT30533.1 hypothetical protein [Aureimonas sp. AU4]
MDELEVSPPVEGGEGTLRIVRHVSATPKRTWTCLTDPDCFRKWWRTHVDFDAKADGQFVAPWVDPEGRGRTVRAQVTSFHPPNGLVMVWADDDWGFDTIVSIWIESEGDGSLVTIEHQGWMAAPERDRLAYMQSHHDDWTRHLSNWAAHAEDTDAHAKGE